MISYIKRYHVEHFYNYICLDFLKKNKNEILKLEKICILMQFESISINNKPMFYCKIYFDKDNPKIEYLSDIFRVMKPQNLGYHQFCSIHKMGKISKKMQKYKKMNIEELDIKITEIRNKKNLNNRYFCKRKYNNKIMCCHARKLARCNEHLILNSLKFILDLIAYMVLLFIPLGYIVLILFNYQSESLVKLTSREYLLFTLMVLILKIILLFVYIRPTRFELDNNY